MDSFGATGILKFWTLVNAVMPLLIAGIALWAVLSTDFIELTTVGPLICLALIAYGIYNLYRFFQASQYRVELSDDCVSVNGIRKPWTDIQRAEIRPATFFSPSIRLHAEDNTILEIIGATQNLTYIRSIVEKQVVEVDRQD